MINGSQRLSKKIIDYTCSDGQIYIRGVRDRATGGNALRKKSHISLAQFIVKNSDISELHQYKKAFYLGSILPDCKPSFLTEKHQFQETFDKVQGYIRDLTENCDTDERNQRNYWRKIGEVIHYIADYFTFPHNKSFPGNLKDHCMYEKELKLYLRKYLRTGEALNKVRTMRNFYSADSLIEFISRKHKEYLKICHSVVEDCRYILQLCWNVVAGIVQLLGMRTQQELVAVAA